MDVSLHWSGAWPVFLRPLLTALEALPEGASAPAGAVALCPDATALAPPAGGASVALVPHPEVAVRGPAAAAVGRWAAEGALLLTPTTTAAVALRRHFGLDDARVRVMPLPLPPEQIPPAAPAGENVIVAVPPINFAALLSAVQLVRAGGHCPRLLLADPAAEPYARPGGLACSYGLLAGHEVATVGNWRQPGCGVAALVVSTTDAGLGWGLREALGSGVPVVAPSSPALSDHLAAVGASAYQYAAAGDPRTLCTALMSVLRGDRGPGLGAAARDAVMTESWEPAARALYRALEDVLAEPGPHPTVPLAHDPTPQRQAGQLVEVSRERLNVCVLNPNASSGGGERFLRQLVGAMAGHESGPVVSVVCEVDSHAVFDAGAELLERAGARTITVGPEAFAQTAAREAERADVVYYSWPHGAAPLDTAAPLVCTFHDLNWKHFDVIPAAQKALMEQQAPLWIARASVMVHSSKFIQEEMRHFYGVAAELTHVIPTAAEDPTRPTTEEREAVRRRFALPERFLLSPNGNHYHKNYPVLLAALRLLRAEGRPVNVVASGMATELIHEPGFFGLGYITAAELQALYEESVGVVQTTLYEAGSFPMAEAMIVGKPVAISQIPPIVEQVERLGVIAELFDPLDPRQVAEAVWRLWTGSPATEPTTLAANAAALATRSWGDVAADYLNLFTTLAQRA